MSDLMTEPQGLPITPPPKPRWYLRPWVIIPAVLVVAAAAIAITVVMVSRPQTMTIRGSVIDRMRPDLGVAAATLEADGTTGKTGATGAFTLTGVRVNAKVQVSAANYSPATVTASATMMTIRLAPIPVDVTVTSAMTGASVKAAVSAPPGEPAVYTVPSGGTLHLYRAGPGDKVTVTADGYQPAHPVVSTDRTLTVPLEPARRALFAQLATWYTQGKYQQMVDWLLRPATGYIFIPVSAQEQAETMKNVIPEVQAYMTGRGIGDSTAWVQVSIIKPGVTPGIQEWTAMAAGNATRVTIAGRIAWHGGPSQEFGSYVTMMQVGPYVVEVYGDSLAETDQIMTKIVSTLLGPSMSAPAAGNAVDKMSAAQATRAAVAALSAAHTVRVVGTSTSDGKPVSFDLRITDEGSRGSITSQGATFQVIIIGKDFFMNGPARSWKATGSPDGVAALLAGRWVKVPGSDRGMDSFTLAAFTSEMMHGTTFARTIARASLNGRDVVLITYSNGSRLYVSQTGQPYPLRYLKTGADGRQVDFTEFGAVVHLAPPKDAIDMTNESARV